MKTVRHQLNRYQKQSKIFKDLKRNATINLRVNFMRDLPRVGFKEGVASWEIMEAFSRSWISKMINNLNQIIHISIHNLFSQRRWDYWFLTSREKECKMQIELLREYLDSLNNIFSREMKKQEAEKSFVASLKKSFMLWWGFWLFDEKTKERSTDFYEPQRQRNGEKINYFREASFSLCIISRDF